MENMAYLRQMLKLEELHNEIRRETTGNQTLLAKKLNISIATLERKLNELRSIGAEIEFDRALQSYRYNNDFTLQVIISTND